jgi:hypothetical protein
MDDSDLGNGPGITLGPIRLEQRQTGELLVYHAALREPVEVDALQLQRWLLRQLREHVGV